MRTPHAHLDRKQNGDIYAVYKLGFSKDAPRFEYCFLGEQKNTLTYGDKILEKHPAFKNVTTFEAWLRKYVAENDL